MLRKRARLTPSIATEWIVSKAGVIPAAVTGLVNRILHRAPHRIPEIPPSLRRHAGVYVWRPTIGPDGLPTDGEIVPLEEFNSGARKQIH